MSARHSGFAGAAPQDGRSAVGFPQCPRGIHSASRWAAREYRSLWHRVAIRPAPPDEQDFFELAGPPDVFSSFSRTFWQPEAAGRSAGDLTFAERRLDLDMLERFRALVDLNLTQLRDHVRACLLSTESVLLSQVLERFPPREGILEIVGYLVVALQDAHNYVPGDQFADIELPTGDGHRESWRVRFRFLDGELQRRVGWPLPDCAVPLPAFSGLDWRIDRVLIVENRDVFLCLPNVCNTLAIFGSGKAALLLCGCKWMSAAQLVYWGDCDEAGFGILSSLRSSFPHLRSALMDEDAWARWKHLATPGRRDTAARHAHLTPSERVALTEVVRGPLMLEQERIPPMAAAEAIVRAFDVIPRDGIASLASLNTARRS